MIRMTNLVRWSIAPLALAFVLTAVVDAQQERGQGRQRGGAGRGGGFSRGGGFGGGTDKVSLVGREEVQKELEIGADQMVFVGEVIADHQTRSRALFTGLGNFREMSEEERTKAFAELTKKREKLTAESEKALAVFLDEDQARRLDQIALQQKGQRGLTDADVAAKLKLSDDQKKKIKDALDGQDKERREMFSGFGRGQGGGNAGGARPDFNAIREKMEALSKKTDETVKGALTVEQKKQFEELKGRPFALPRRGFGNSGGGGNRNRGGQDGGNRNRRPRPEAE